MPTTLSSHSKNSGGGAGCGASADENTAVASCPSMPLLPLTRERKKALSSFLRSRRLKFSDYALLNLAFVHRSVSNETGCKLNNERLEFLGDSVIGVIAATLLFTRYNDKSEGEIAKAKSAIVSEDMLSALAREIQIDSLLILGHGEENSGGRVKKALLADALEALVGAIYLDQGYDKTFAFVKSLLEPEIERVVNREYLLDYKSILQEESQKRFHSYPQYKLLKRSGPEHDRYFWVDVVVGGKKYGPGTGHNKKSAEQEAAKSACEDMGIPNE